MGRGFPWNDFRLEPLAAWMTMLRDLAYFISDHPHQHPIFDMLGVTAMVACCYDYMHMKYPGTDKSLLGSILYTMVHIIMGGSAQDNMRELWNRLVAEYTAQ